MSDLSIETAGTPPAKNRGPLRWLGYALALGLLGFIVAKADWTNMGVILRSAHPGWVVAMLVLAHLQFVLAAVIWDRFLRKRGAVLPFMKLVQFYLIGNFFSTMLPTKYSGDIYRAYAVGRITGKNYTAAATVLLERLSGMFVLLLMGFVASLFAGKLLAKASMSYPILMIFGMFLAAACLLFTGRLFYVFEKFVVAVRLKFLVAPMERFHDAVMEFADDKGFLIRINALAFFIKMFAFVCIYIGAIALSIDVPFQALILIMPLIYVLEAAPISIYGMGIREGGFVFFFTQVGLSYEQAFALSIIVLFGRFVCAFTGGLIYLFSGRSVPTPADTVRAMARSGKPSDSGASNAVAVNTELVEG